MVKVLLFISTFFRILSPLQATEDSPYTFERITANEGLSNNSVRRILQDKKGFLWFGTLNGLNRYDGKNYRVFKSEPGNLNSLSNNRIHLMVEDTLEYIWIVTFDNEVQRFDPRTESFLNIDRKIKTKNSDYIVRSKGIVEGSPGIVWIIPENGGLIRFKGSANAEDYAIHLFNTDNLLPSNNVKFVHRDKTGATWIGTDKGVISLQSDTFDSIPPPPTYFNDVKSVDFREYCESSEGIWFGTERHGIYRYSFKEAALQAWNQQLNINAPITSFSLKNDNSLIVTTFGSGVLYIEEEGRRFSHFTVQHKKDAGAVENTFTGSYADQNGLFWLISTTRRGVTLFNPAIQKFRYYDLNAKFREPLGDSEKHIFFEDSNGYLWLGLYGGGLCRFDNKKEEFDQYFHSQTNPGSISSNMVLSIYEDRSKNLWIGTFHGGLNKLSLYKNNFTHIKPNPDASFRLENEVRSVVEDKFGRIWVGTKAGKVNCYDDNNNLLYTIPHDLPASSSFRMHSVYALLRDDKENLWIGTKSDGLFRIDGILDSLGLKGIPFQIHNFRRNPQDITSLSFNTVYALLQDKTQQVWVGTYNGGLDLIKNPYSKNIVFDHFKAGSSREGALSDNRVRHLMLDHANNLWIGTSDGLNLLKAKYINAPEKKFTRFVSDPSNDLSISNNDIIFLHQDHQNIIWAGTYGGGLNKLLGEDYESGDIQFKNYTQAEGLPSDVIYSIEEDASGHLWLSTDNGLSKFSPISLHVENYLKEDGLGESVFSEATSLKTSKGELVFGNLNGFVRFSPAMISKDTRHYPIVFTDFKIFNERIRPTVNESPLKRSIESTKEITLAYNQNFISIEFGVLDFKAPEKTQYSYILENFEDKWNYSVGENQAVYRGLEPGEYIFKVKGTNSDGVWVDSPKVLKMTILPPFWKTNWAYLVYTVVILTGLAAIAYFVRHEIRLQNQVTLEKRLTANKIEFYTNISHEFKTPLSLILGPAEDLFEDPTLPSPLKSKMELIKRNSMRLLKLMEQLMDFRRVQSGKMELKVQKVQLFNFFYDFYLSFLPLAEKKQVEFHFNPNFKEKAGWIDPRHVEKIIMNLLSNAFKYASGGKNIFFEPEIDRSGKILKITIKDQGNGISKDNVSKVFERFSNTKSDQIEKVDSSGIGLSLTRDLTYLHKGQISVKNGFPNGSIFSVTLPIDEDAYSLEEKHITPLLDHGSIDQDNYLKEDSVTYNSEKSQPMPSASSVKNKVLLIEDNDDLRNYLADKLRRYYVVSTSSDGDAGFESAIKLMPDLIVCDIMMPGLSGLEVTEKLKQNINTSHIPIILLTARTSNDQKLEGIEIGADDYITKPFNFRYLQIRIRKLIEQRKKLRDKFSNEPGLKVTEIGDTPADQQFLTKVIAIIEERMEDTEFNVDTLIEELSCSRTFFYKKLKRISGHSPNEFIRTIRMKKAALLLKNGDFNVAEISYKVGISDPNYFSKCFKTHFGETPSIYYKKNKSVS